MKSLTRVLILLLLLFLTRICIAQDSKSKVIVKVTKIVDGDTTVSEKTINESDLPYVEKEATTTKDGKKLKIKISVNKEDDIQTESEDLLRKFNFNFRMDSLGENSMFTADSLFKFGNTGMEELIKKLSLQFGNMDSSQTSLFNLNEDSMSKFIMKSVQDIKSGKSAYLFSDEDGGDGKTYTNTSVKIIDLEGKKTKNKSNLAIGKVDFYPNPNNGTFSLDLEVTESKATLVTITDSNGKEVYRDEVKGKGKHSRQVELGEKSKGTYILKLKQGDKANSKKLIIE